MYINIRLGCSDYHSSKGGSQVKYFPFSTGQKSNLNLLRSGFCAQILCIHTWVSWLVFLTSARLKNPVYTLILPREVSTHYQHSVLFPDFIDAQLKPKTARLQEVGTESTGDFKETVWGGQGGLNQHRFCCLWWGHNQTPSLQHNKVTSTT